MNLSIFLYSYEKLEKNIFSGIIFSYNLDLLCQKSQILEQDLEKEDLRNGC